MATKPAPKWRTIPGTDGAYSVSDAGDVRSNARRVSLNYPGVANRARVVPERILAAHFIKGSKAVTIGGKTVMVRRLVAAAFVRNPDPAVNTRVAHVDGNADNCSAVNLQWLPPLTPGAETRARGVNAARAVLDDTKVRAILRKCTRKTNPVTQSAVAAEYGVSVGTVNAIVTGRTWGHVTGIVRGA